RARERRRISQDRRSSVPMRVNRLHGMALAACLASLALALPVLAEELRGTVKSVDDVNSRIVVHDEVAQRDVVVNFNRLTTLKSKDSSLSDLKDVKPGSRVSITDSITASRVSVDEAGPAAETQAERSMLAEFWYNFRHNLFKPLLLFFYLGFLVP